ncbi:hypothetical protein IMZ31_17140 [Pontibacillus sp. ALD_SL1]|uniref:hypothetical protein n=1 Tax=Pontibacillus sp. ALD_SL1 TaxID=2777185 RepID=UPI001A95C0B2|nr:hypothetical protein [Pontibacillus sp. ALD_SL1]QSS99766.1 hypothetical protein IMZ31_17140 [Pontibacillus sp. ALD_SL1]
MNEENTITNIFDKLSERNKGTIVTGVTFVLIGLVGATYMAIYKNNSVSIEFGQFKFNTNHNRND